uniref:Uncharacterized protein n=1 Tax=Arion vulgaris TaxID=1028688 RepID=A0A0B7B695_9EUPU
MIEAYEENKTDPSEQRGEEKIWRWMQLEQTRGKFNKKGPFLEPAYERKRRERRCTQRRDLEAEFIDMQNNKKELLEKIFKERQIWHELVNCLCCNRGTIERLPSFVFVPRNIDHSLVLI